MSRFWLLLLAAGMVATGCGGSDAPALAEPDASLPRAPTQDPHARALATSASHTCALRKAGVFCWGANDDGQLGDRTTTRSEVPVRAQIDAEDIVELAVHAGRSCVRRRSGAVACWGLNASGQLGDGTRSDSLTPVEPELADASQLALSEATSCALRRDGSVWCWGGSPEDADGAGSLTPQAVAGIAGAVELRSGPMSTYCARGEAWTRCFRLEGGTWTTPVELPALAAASGIALASAEQVCAVVSGGEVVCAEVSGGSSSVRLAGSRGTIQLAGGLLTVCGGDIVGAWYCWNILSPMVLQTIGAPRSELTSGPFDELVTAGFRFCGLGPSAEVQCMERNASAPAWLSIDDLPE